MSFIFTLKPRDQFNPIHHDVRFKNNFVDNINKMLSGWEPVSHFPKDKTFEMSYDHDGSITFTLNFLCFISDKDEMAGKAIVNMMRQEGLDTHYYLSSTANTHGHSLVGINESLKKGYGYPVSFFPEFSNANQTKSANTNAAQFRK